MLLLILPLGLENISTNWNFTDSDLIEQRKIQKMSEIENTSCLRSVMKVTPVDRKGREDLGAAIIIRRVNDGL